MTGSATDVTSTGSANSPRSLKAAREIAQPSEFSPALTDKIYRSISIYPSYVLARTPITPNQLTYLWIVLGLVASVALDAPRYRYRVAGAVLFQLSYLFDYVDGEVARLQNRRSKKGFLLDLLGHALIKMALFLALGIRFLHSSFAAPALILGSLASIGIANGNALPCFAAFAGYRNGGTASGVNPPEKKRSLAKLALTFVALLFESPGIYAAVLLGVVTESTRYVLVFYGVLGPLWMMYRTAKY